MSNLNARNTDDPDYWNIVSFSYYHHHRDHIILKFSQILFLAFCYCYSIRHLSNIYYVTGRITIWHWYCNVSQLFFGHQSDLRSGNLFYTTYFLKMPPSNVSSKFSGQYIFYWLIFILQEQFAKDDDKLSVLNAKKNLETNWRMCICGSRNPNRNCDLPSAPRKLFLF